MKDLNETIGMMCIGDFKDRIRAEYWQLKIRCEKLEEMCRKYAAGELDFKPNCGLELLRKQLGYMQNYLACLELRAEIESIDLNKEDYEDDSRYHVIILGNTKGIFVQYHGNSIALLGSMVYAIANEMVDMTRDDVSDGDMALGIAKDILHKMQEMKERKKNKEELSHAE